MVSNTKFLLGNVAFCLTNYCGVNFLGTFLHFLCKNITCQCCRSEFIAETTFFIDDRHFVQMMCDLVRFLEGSRYKLAIFNCLSAKAL